MDKHENQAEILVPFLCAGGVFIVALYSQMIAIAFALISLVAIGAYHAFMKK